MHMLPIVASKKTSAPTRGQHHNRSSRVLKIIPALVAALLVIQSSAAQAVIPAATSTTSVITVKVGGTRSGAVVVNPVAGVHLSLYDGTNATIPSSSATPLADSWATCISDADGDCSFVIPDTGVGGANRDKRFYIQQTGSSPAGWYADPTLVTSTNGTTFNSTPYAVRTGAQLRAGQNYVSTTDFMITGTGAQASTGIWPESLNNP
ncbi:MAG: hypothetical protein FWF25_08740, partial [Propionibacteriaceae bacterium]|nr:hypothetical protein [Propionibacteriaceae bacterium]